MGYNRLSVLCNAEVSGIFPYTPNALHRVIVGHLRCTLTMLRTRRYIYLSHTILPYFSIEDFLCLLLSSSKDIYYRPYSTYRPTLRRNEDNSRGVPRIFGGGGGEIRQRS